MHHLSQRMISMEVRQPHINRVKRRMMRQLQTPGLDMESRQRIQNQIATLGNPKVYTQEGSNLPWAISPGPMSDEPPEIDFSTATTSSLTTQLHTNLVRHAHKLGIDVPNAATKAQVIKMILDSLEKGIL